jgi:WD40 repeat protein
MYELNPSKSDLVLKHDRQLWQARFTPCGRFLIACGYDATLQRWDISGAEPRLMPPLTGHEGWVQSIAIHPTEPRVYSADSWGRIGCWDYASESGTATWTKADAHDGWIRSIALDPGATMLATAGNDKVVRLWSPADGKPLGELTHPLRLFSVAFHPDGKSLVTGDLEGTVRQWDIATRTETRKLDAGRLYSHDSANNQIQHCGGARILAFDASGKRLACGGQKEPQGGFAKGTPCVLIFDWESGELLREMPMGGSEDGFTYDVGFHPEGFVIATSSAFPGKGHTWFWKPEEEKAFFSSNKLTNGRTLSIHPDGKRVAFLSSNSPNGNGRSLKEGEYAGGFAEIRILPFADPAAPQTPAS